MAGKFRVVWGDACADAGYAEALGGRTAQLLLTDPPYCLLTRRRKGGDLRDKRDRKIDRDPVVRFETVRDYRRFTEEWLPRAASHLSPNARMVIWTNFLGKEPVLAVAQKVGYAHCWGEFVWAKKTREVNANEQLLRVYEVALVLSRTPAPARTLGDPSDIWSVVAGYDDDGEAEQWGSHPHHKPFSVLEPLVRAYSQPGDCVLDPFAGSGSIPAAALKLERQAAGIEKEAEWAERVGQRLSQL